MNSIQNIKVIILRSPDTSVFYIKTLNSGRNKRFGLRYRRNINLIIRKLIISGYVIFKKKNIKRNKI